jgi:hypothetical protein
VVCPKKQRLAVVKNYLLPEKKEFFMKNVSKFLLAVVFGLFAACDKDTTPIVTNVPVSGVTVSPTSRTLLVGGEYPLSANVQPANASNKTVTWSSSDETIVTFVTGSSGRIKGIAVGSATITVTTEDGEKEATCNVTVKPLPESIAITNPPNKTNYYTGETINLEGLVVTATYSDNSTEPISNEDINVNPRTWTTDGEKEVTITYGGKTATFTVMVVALPAGTVIVTSDADTNTDGTLRYAIARLVPNNGTIIIDNSIKTIVLSSKLPDITKSITIEGNGVTLTPAGGWTAANYSQLMQIGSYGNSGMTVKIDRVWFKDGKSLTDGGAILNYGGDLTLESCIFSGNNNKNGSGGAIYNRNPGTLNIKSCTFYGNSSGFSGGAVYNGGAITLSGNLFFGNTASNNRSIVTNGTGQQESGTVTSNGYNVVDVALGTGESGWTAGPSDTQVNVLPISPVSLKLVSGSGAADVIDALPSEYPARDFFGEEIIVPAAAGAVQSSTSSSGFSVHVTVNTVSYNAAGNISIEQEPDEEGLYAAGTVTLTATPTATPISDYGLNYWLVDGEYRGYENPLSLNITSHTSVHAVFSRMIIVDKFSDGSGSATTPGTLRYAITSTNARAFEIIRLSGVTPGETTIALTSRLPEITRSITIEGNGVILTPAASWTENNDSQLIYINGSSVTVKISRVHFKDGRSTWYGTAIRNNNGNLTLESCIFSGGRAEGVTYGYGGAIYNTGGNTVGNLNIKGCTFYKNSSLFSGGAIYKSAGSLTLTGNLFYENTTSGDGPVVFDSIGTGTAVSSNGYNVVDVALGTGNAQSGWTAATGVTGDIKTTSQPIAPASFRLLSGSEAANVMSSLPEDYPLFDFYGDEINAPAAAGAVQSTASGSGHALGLMVNNNAWGSVNVTTPVSDTDGIYSGTITITATPATDCELVNWLVNGENKGSTNPLSLTLTAHTVVQAVFTRVLTVDNFTDGSGSATTPGTLRHAITNVRNGEIIRLSGVTSGTTTITLTSSLPSITKRNITIEGNGIILSPASVWTESAYSQLMNIDRDGIVTIKCIWFKDGKATRNGAAIYNPGGNLTLESCIFSGNETTDTYSTGSGSAIYNTTHSSYPNINPILNVKGCTFYGNISGDTTTDAVIYNNGEVALTGNLFYNNNTPSSRSIVANNTSKVTTSLGYNVVDLNFGTGTNQCGWANTTGNDTYRATTPFSNTDTFVPLTDVRSLIPPAFAANMPAMDFHWETRTYPGAPGAVK